jgi:transcriptional regulator with XRE-family HTH domain
MPTITSRGKPLPAEPRTQLGAGLRRQRRARGLTMDELARRVGVDKAHLSRIENNLRSPSVSMLAQLAEALGVSMGYLLGETLDKTEVKVTRGALARATRRPTSEGHFLLPLLHGESVGSFEAFLVAPGADPGAAEAQHAGQEMLFILSGKVQILFHTHTEEVGAGDCVHFPGHLQHRLRRVGRAKALALVVVSNE